MNKTNNPPLKPYAQKLRREMTREEKHLWYDFLNRLPVRFNRQKVIGPYIVDFYCASAGLVVELDGSQHYEEEGRITDSVRDDYMAGLGLRVLRYTNVEVHRNFRRVCEDIMKYLPQKASP